MSGTELRAFLKKTGITPTQVAAATGLSIGTVYNFLRGENVTRANARAIAEFVASKSKVSPGQPKAATG